MKNKYQRSSKEEKKEARNKYYKTKEGQKMKNRFIRNALVTIFCFGYSVFIFIDNFLNSNNIWMYSFSALMFVAGLLFLYFGHKFKIILINDYMISKKK